MGKRTRKTRWRTLEIGDSDSEESSTLQSQTSKNYPHRPPFYSKYTFSSQSTPTRRFAAYDAKSTRSSSTASDTKITFNEDEYTKITTPRQDVLFKKGYLNKPKTYQTQTSTGNSTASTGNSTGNGTPDHQSADGTECTDVEYETQFVFPNAFVDHNGIYYINSYEPYPLVMYNPQLCYPEYPISRSKRLSTGSLTESTSPNNEETSQDQSQSGGETNATVPEYNHVYMYQGYYYNNPCGSNAPPEGATTTSEPRKVKKRRKRRVSKTTGDGSSSTSEDYESSEEVVSQIENTVAATDGEEPSEEKQENAQIDGQPEVVNEETKEESEDEETPQIDDPKEATTKGEEEQPEEVVRTDEKTPIKKGTKFNLNAEEFVPRFLRASELPANQIDSNIQFVNVHPNFIPLPFVNHPLNEIGAQGFPPAFLPPGIALGFLPHDHKIIPNFINFVPNQFYAKPFESVTTKKEAEEAKKVEAPTKKEEEPPQHQQEEKPKVHHQSQVDIAKIVSKLEEAAKEQRQSETTSKRNFRSLKYHKTQRKANFQSEHGGFRNNFDRRRNFDKRRNERYQEEAAEKDERTDENPAKPEEKELKMTPITKTEEKFHSPRRNFVKTPSPHVTPKRFNNFHKNNQYSPKPRVPTQEPSPTQLNYSETLKRPSVAYQKSYSPKYERVTEKTPLVPIKTKEEYKPKSPNQWISVSNRKKRKNKPNNEEDTNFPVEETEENTEDILILTKEEELMIIEDNKKLQEQRQATPPPKEEAIDRADTVPLISSEEQDVIEMIRESTPVKTTTKEEIVLQDIQEIEKELLKESSLDVTVETFKEEPKKPKENKRKPQKKNLNKPAAKRVLVKDIDFSSEESALSSKSSEQKTQFVKKQCASIKEDANENEENVPLGNPEEVEMTKDENKSTDKAKEIPSGDKEIICTIKEIEDNSSKIIIDDPKPTTDNSAIKADLSKVEENVSKVIETVSTPEEVVPKVEVAPLDKKKSSKKKKKIPKPTTATTMISQSSSSTTLNTLDESYDFLLDASVLEDQKTNVEVSEELDKIIQKGLLGSIEEKIKSLNVSIDEDFFRSLNFSPKQPTPEKGFMKAPDFSSILKNNSQFRQKNRPESAKIDLDFSKITLPDQPSTSKDCAFLDLPQVKEDEGKVSKKGKDRNGKLKNKSKKSQPLPQLSSAGEETENLKKEEACQTKCNFLEPKIDNDGDTKEIKRCVSDILNEVCENIPAGMPTGTDEECSENGEQIKNNDSQVSNNSPKIECESFVNNEKSHASNENSFVCNKEIHPKLMGVSSTPDKENQTTPNQVLKKLDVEESTNKDIKEKLENSGSSDNVDRNAQNEDIKCEERQRNEENPTIIEESCLNNKENYINGEEQCTNNEEIHYQNTQNKEVQCLDFEKNIGEVNIIRSTKDNNEENIKNVEETSLNDSRDVEGLCKIQKENNETIYQNVSLNIEAEIKASDISEDAFRQSVKENQEENRHHHTKNKVRLHFEEIPFKTKEISLKIGEVHLKTEEIPLKSEETPKTEELSSKTRHSFKPEQIPLKSKDIPSKMEEVELKTEEIFNSEPEEIPFITKDISSKTEETLLESEETHLKSEYVPSKIEEVHLKAEEIPFTSKEILPKTEKVALKTGEIALKSKEISSKMEEIPFKTKISLRPEGIRSKSDEVALKTEEFSLKFDEIRLKYEEINSKTEEVALKTEEIPLKSKKIPSKMEEVPFKTEISLRPEEIRFKPKAIPLKSDDIALKSEHILYETEEVPFKAKISLRSEKNPFKPTEITLKSEEITLKSEGFPLKADEIRLKPGEKIPSKTEEILSKPAEISLKYDEIPLKTEEVSLKFEEINLEADEVPWESTIPLKSEEILSKTKEGHFKTKIPLGLEEIPLKADEPALKSEEIPSKTEETSLKSEDISLKTDQTSLKSAEVHLEAIYRSKDISLGPKDICSKYEKMYSENEEIPFRIKTHLKPEEIPSKSKESSSNIALKIEEIPLKHGETPSKCEQIPLEPKEISSEIEEIAFQTEDIPLKPEEIQFQQPKQFLLKTEETDFKTEEIVLKSGETSLEREEIHFESEETPSKTEENLSKSEDIPLKYDEIPLKTEEVSLKFHLEAEEVPLKLELIPLKSEETSPTIEETGLENEMISSTTSKTSLKIEKTSLMMEESSSGVEDVDTEAKYAGVHNKPLSFEKAFLYVDANSLTTKELSIHSEHTFQNTEEECKHNEETYPDIKQTGKTTPEAKVIFQRLGKDSLNIKETSPKHTETSLTTNATFANIEKASVDTKTHIEVEEAEDAINIEETLRKEADLSTKETDIRFMNKDFGYEYQNFEDSGTSLESHEGKLKIGDSNVTANLKKSDNLQISNHAYTKFQTEENREQIILGTDVAIEENVNIQINNIRNDHQTSLKVNQSNIKIEERQQSKGDNLQSTDGTEKKSGSLQMNETTRSFQSKDEAIDKCTNQIDEEDLPTTNIQHNGLQNRIDKLEIEETLKNKICADVEIEEEEGHELELQTTLQIEDKCRNYIGSSDSRFSVDEDLQIRSEIQSNLENEGHDLQVKNRHQMKENCGGIAIGGANEFGIEKNCESLSHVQTNYQAGPQTNGNDVRNCADGGEVVGVEEDEYMERDHQFNSTVEIPLKTEEIPSKSKNIHLETKDIPLKPEEISLETDEVTGESHPVVKEEALKNLQMKIKLQSSLQTKEELRKDFVTDDFRNNLDLGNKNKNRSCTGGEVTEIEIMKDTEQNFKIKNELRSKDVNYHTEEDVGDKIVGADCGIEHGFHFNSIYNGCDYFEDTKNGAIIQIEERRGIIINEETSAKTSVAHNGYVLRNEEISNALEATNENISQSLTIPKKSITQAVFEWMTRTREKTPEIEILKSPDTINREFSNLIGLREEEEEGEEEINLEEFDVKRGLEKSAVEEGSEITIFESCSKNAAPIEQGEDVLEVYESKYGNNEDFMKLEEEIEEIKRRRNSKHGDLPYRAICCSLM